MKKVMMTVGLSVVFLSAVALNTLLSFYFHDWYNEFGWIYMTVFEGIFGFVLGSFVPSLLKRFK